MNTDAFTGKAQAYANARPGYPEAAIEYIKSLVPAGAVFADVGAGTGKFTELLAKNGYKIFAVEPNADMRGQLAVTLGPFPNAKIVAGTAEATTLPENSVDVITCAQALGWFDLAAFRTECRRIGKPGAVIIALYNGTPGDDSVPASHRFTSAKACEMFFKNPEIRDFPNPVFNTREKWIEKSLSISDNPMPSDPGYAAHAAELNEAFDRYSSGGILRVDLITTVYSERIE